MVKIALFRRRSRAAVTLKRTDTDFTDDSTRSETTLSVSTNSKSPSPPRASSSRWSRASLTSGNNNNTNNNKKKRVRFTTRPKVHAHYSRLDEDISIAQLWWTPQELKKLLQLEMKPLMTNEDIQAKKYPRVVQDWASVVDRFYRQQQEEHDLTVNKEQTEGPVQDALDATLAWRGLEEYMVDKHHHDRVEEHVFAVLRTARQSKPLKALVVVPPPMSRAAAVLAQIIGHHDAQQAKAAED